MIHCCMCSEAPATEKFLMFTLCKPCLLEVEDHCIAAVMSLHANKKTASESAISAAAERRTPCQ